MMLGEIVGEPGKERLVVGEMLQALLEPVLECHAVAFCFGGIYEALVGEFEVSRVAQCQVAIAFHFFIILQFVGAVQVDAGVVAVALGFGNANRGAEESVGIVEIHAQELHGLFIASALVEEACGRVEIGIVAFEPLKVGAAVFRGCVFIFQAFAAV